MHKPPSATIPLHPITDTNGLEGRKIHVRLTEGRFQHLRRLISWPLLAAFFGLVWMQTNGTSWLLFDFPERRILLFGAHFSWYDLHILTGLMITAASLLFFVSMIWGRVWCGFACPQTIWTWIFIRIEHWTEGRAALRQRQEKMPLSGARLARRLLKHTLWLAVALITAVTFTGYFMPIRDLVTQLANANAPATLVGWLVCMTLLTYINTGLVREKICLHACPYSRFQAVMMDDQSLKVSYDSERGEPRGSMKLRNSVQQTKAAVGDCVDCNICVQVCPTGIDIRDGLQAACIDCAACIDACDQVMLKTQRPTGLIRFAAAQEQPQPQRFWRPRLLGYFAVTLIAFSSTGYALVNKKDLVVEIRRDRASLYREFSDGLLCNFYQIKADSFDPGLTQINVSVSGPEGLVLQGPETFLLDNSGEWTAYRVCLTDPAAGVLPITFNFSDQSRIWSRSSSLITSTSYQQR
ncbi:cytochrome c oxidase accessory protein CcoG [Nitrincola sp.]|uniref:cytochrome c oxidase accessory protein CcoG n=1 Tax=Nitrincola sp. TaxID=1926584 RepID=UPI003A955BEC